MVIKKPSLQLSEVLDDVDFTQLHGHMVIKGLLNMLLELRKVNATLHNLTPEGVFVSSQGTKLMLVDLLALTFKDMPVLGMSKGSMPYSNQDLKEHEQTGYHRQERTMWSVGMMILQLFVGSEVVQCFYTHQDVMEGLTHVQNELGNRLYGLIRALMFEVSFEVIKETLDGGILDSPERVAKSIRHAGKRIRDSNFIQELLNA